MSSMIDPESLMFDLLHYPRVIMPLHSIIKGHWNPPDEGMQETTRAFETIISEMEERQARAVMEK